ncbi:MutS-related protein [Flaviaesturariibacter amylovorans]|uniref:MutS family DNA mismatch repair protein n=1 Tax=Flaviaesturariibacter amylovorans TaxID=1084520 RepID=A0ABP8HT88_9BACT
MNTTPPPAPEAAYTHALAGHQADLARALRKRNRLGWLRLLAFLATAASVLLLFGEAGAWGLVPAIAGIALLLRLVVLDVNNAARIRHLRVLIGINEEELRCLAYQFGARFDGAAFEPHEHPYARDLDLFGPASLYQWIQRCGTEPGQARLADDLLAARSSAVIGGRQALVQELAPDRAWRQEFYARARRSTLRTETERKALTWSSQDATHFVGSGWRPFVTGHSVLMITAALAAATGYLPVPLFSLLYGVSLAASLLLGRRTVDTYRQLGGIVPEIETLRSLLESIEQRASAASLWNEWKSRAMSDGASAAREIGTLKGILDRFDLRLNIMGLLLLNPFLLWDVRQQMALNEWRRRNGRLVAEWFALVAEAEVWNTLATLRFNQPGWCLPSFRGPHFYWRSAGLGHPLLPPDRRVTNDLPIEGTGRVALVTGSNMAGKSTFLRSLGVNSVLAHLGGPVCATMLELSHHRLMSSMRIADNLAESTSTFYAELKKIKSVIDAANRKEPVFILLDEILRGTNSQDRHTGSEALIRQLLRQGAVAVIATHDTALAALAGTYPGGVINYHFDVQVEGEELYFDYRLKTGVCRSLNASILMRKIGIELDEHPPSDLQQ